MYIYILRQRQFQVGTHLISTNKMNSLRRFIHRNLNLIGYLKNHVVCQ